MPSLAAASGRLDDVGGTGVFWRLPNMAVTEDAQTQGMTNKIYRALADPTRRRILTLLRERPMTAGELAGQFELTWPTMSGHFAVLREAGLVQAERSGTSVTYRLNQTVLQEALMALFDAFGFDPTEGRA
jgi:DNA-binding transcriptional ArsR family regulator